MLHYKAAILHASLYFDVGDAVTSTISVFPLHLHLRYLGVHFTFTFITLKPIQWFPFTFAFTLIWIPFTFSFTLL